MYYNEKVTCPKCNEKTKRAGFHIWQWLVTLFFFPLGALSLLAGRKNTICSACNHEWKQ